MYIPEPSHIWLHLTGICTTELACHLFVLYFQLVAQCHIPNRVSAVRGADPTGTVPKNIPRGSI